MVLYIMGIMFSDNEWIKITRQTHIQAPIAIIFILIFFAFFGHKLYNSDYPSLSSKSSQQVTVAQTVKKPSNLPYPKMETNPRSVAVKLYSDYLYPFEVASVLLTVAVLGGIFLAKKEV